LQRNWRILKSYGHWHLFFLQLVSTNTTYIFKITHGCWAVSSVSIHRGTIYACLYSSLSHSHTHAHTCTHSLCSYYISLPLPPLSLSLSLTLSLSLSYCLITGEWKFGNSLGLACDSRVCMCECNYIWKFVCSAWGFIHMLTNCYV
jgi:hypothetical protein